MLVCLFGEEGQKKVVEVMVDKAPLTHVSIEDIGQYQAALVNYDDHDFVKIVIDPKSQAFFTKNLNQVGSALNQKLVVRAMFEQVKDANLSADQYMDFVEHNQTDLDDDILSSMMAFLGGAIHHYSAMSDQYNLNDRAYTIVKK